MSAHATAPGKVMLAGEYAVLEGAQAVVAAVNRRVRAQVQPGPLPARSPFLDAVRETIAEHAGADSVAARAAACLVVNSSALYATGTKLGLGSSAAVTVAATACALHADTPHPRRALIHRLAHAAHARAQRARGASGSGADIAACVYGGIVAVRRAADPAVPVMVRPLASRSAAHLVHVWTGTAADTPALVARVTALRDRDPQAYARAMAAIADAAEAVVTALRPSAPASELVAAIDAGADAARRLSRDTGVDIETPAHRALGDLARAAGGAAKPTGAGAGDLALAAFARAEDAAAFVAACQAHGFTIVDLALTPAGVETA